MERNSALVLRDDFIEKDILEVVTILVFSDYPDYHARNRNILFWTTTLSNVNNHRVSRWGKKPCEFFGRYGIEYPTVGRKTPGSKTINHQKCYHCMKLNGCEVFNYEMMENVQSVVTEWWKFENRELAKLMEKFRTSGQSGFWRKEKKQWFFNRTFPLKVLNFRLRSWLKNLKL